MFDQAIRKKIESELSRKRTISTTHQSSRKQRGGKLAALKPSPALTVPENISVAEASQLCAAKRTDCVLVVDEEEGLSGIFTAKDLAYRVRLFCCRFHFKLKTQLHRSLRRVLTHIRLQLARL